jgi:hypothetical protein
MVKILVINTSLQHVSDLIVHPQGAVAQWLRYCATNQKDAGSIPDGVIGILH